MAKEFLIDVNRCTGCWTCAQACKAAFDLDVSEYRMFVRTIGGGGMDKAGGEWPNVYMKWNPVFKQTCVKCRGDKYTDGIPHCVYNCPAGAMYYGDPDDPESDYAKAKEALLDRGFHAWTFPAWEDTPDGVTYMEKGI